MHKVCGMVCGGRDVSGVWCGVWGEDVSGVCCVWGEGCEWCVV